MKESQITETASGSGLLIDPELLSKDSEAFKQALIAQIRARGGTRVVDTKSLFQDLMKQTLEAFLKVEMEEQLGYPRYAAEGRGSGNSRNGSPRKPFGASLGKSKSKRRATAMASSSPGSLPNARARSATSPTWSSRSIPAA
jgi:hypothetical protein